MKKYIIKTLLLSFVLILSSCEENVESWDSNTIEYSGTYFWELYNEDMTTKYIEYDHDIQLLIYNTASNTPNEVWMEDTDHVFPLKSKFTLTGNASEFASQSSNFEDLHNNELAITAPSVKPTGLGQETVESRDYIRNTIIEGKILTDAGTTISGNPVDSFYMKIKLYSGTVKFTSKTVPVELRTDPEVEEFAWEYDSATYDNTLDETYVLSGHRKTGFPEDDH